MFDIAKKVKEKSRSLNRHKVIGLLNFPILRKRALDKPQLKLIFVLSSPS